MREVTALCLRRDLYGAPSVVTPVAAEGAQGLTGRASRCLRSRRRLAKHTVPERSFKRRHDRSVEH